MRFTLQCFALAASAVLAIVGSGCGGADSGHPPCFPVRGTVTYNGKPPAGAIVRLWPVGSDPMDTKTVKPEAMVGEDGSYNILSFNPDDGAPVGEYAVTVRWSGPDAPPGPDLMGDRFSNPKRPVLKVTINDSGNEIPPIELKGPPIVVRNAKKGRDGD